MLQIQCHKMYGHHFDAYAFGSGVDKFPVWLKRQGGVWRGIKRLVGNRSGIFLENSIVMYYMSEWYKKYCRYMLAELKLGNALHQRLEAKLECVEVLAGLKARALFFLVFHQPIRVCIKSTKFGGGKPPTQLHLHPVWNKLYSEVSVRMHK